MHFGGERNWAKVAKVEYLFSIRNKGRAEEFMSVLDLRRTREGNGLIDLRIIYLVSRLSGDLFLDIVKTPEVSAMLADAD